MRKSNLLCTILASAVLLSSGCASIVSKSAYPISINSTPSNAKITIMNDNGAEIHSGNTPATFKLDASAGFFKRARYQVKFEKEGYDTKTVPVRFKVDGWYWGNIVFGGFIGFLIVDPASGAMYKLETEFLNETLSKTSACIDEIPSQWKNKLVLLEE